jgi:hypothetical protein
METSETLETNIMDSSPRIAMRGEESQNNILHDSSSMDGANEHRHRQ